MSGRLQDSVAIVTGAGSVGPGWGNGRATAVRFAEEGAQDIRRRPRSRQRSTETVERVKKSGGEIVTQQCDVTDSASVAAMVQACLDSFGRIDVLVNNVGGSAQGGPVEMAEEVWDAQVDFNLKSVFLTCKHVLPVMETPGRRRDRQCRLDLRPALDRLRAGRLCGDQGRRDPAVARGRRAICARKGSA